MQDSYMIGKMNAFMHSLAEQMSSWMNQRLPRITDNWWNELVYNNLSPLQRDLVDNRKITELSGLDLASLLRVFDRNWYVITSSEFINSKYRQQARDMIEIRNFWAHLSSEELSKEKVIGDVKVIIDLMFAFDAKLGDTGDMQSFIIDVQSDKEMQEKTATLTCAQSSNNETEDINADITVGSMITLVSDPSKVGAVISFDKDKYTVWMDNVSQTFYREQIQLKHLVQTDYFIPLSTARSSLTAYQINNPSSSNLYSLNSARIDFVPYQFRPALKLIKSEMPRLLVADDVGVGKTIEAGLILKEMEARSSIESVLIICPRPLVAERKWVLEMKRFDESFTQLDGKELLECISETDRDGEWPERHRKTIIPYSLFGEDMLSGTDSKSAKKRKTKGLLQLDPPPHFDLVIVDEAHTIRNSNTYAYKGVKLFTDNADAVVFLTATPLQNSNNDLYTLLNLLRDDVVFDMDTFQTMAEPNKYINELLRVVRNQEVGWQKKAKEEISNILSTSWGRSVVQHNPSFAKVFDLADRVSITREEKVEAISSIESLHSFNSIITRTRRRDIEDFCVRHTQTIKVSFTESQQLLYDSLMDFEKQVLIKMHGVRSVRFMMCTIMRQAASCIYGLAPFINDIINRKMNQVQEDGELYDNDIDLSGNVENSIYELADLLIKLTVQLPSEDPKFDKLIEVIEKKQLEDNNRIILFSSFRHTLGYIKKRLIDKGYRVAQVDGSVSDEERFKIRERFLLDREDENAVDILLFSEVGCEGLDYQFCDTLINYDLPWNPMRIEQRIGRIDRRGQKSEAVRIINMITDNTIDAVIHDRCLSKIGVFEASIGDCSEILGDISEQLFKIMLDPVLTDDERKMKIEKMADNEVMKVQEINRLEQEEKNLYGFDLSNYIQNKDVQDAENEWISPNSISDLVDSFLASFLGDGEYVLTNKQNELRTLRLSIEKKRILKDDWQRIKRVNSNSATKQWDGFLKASTPMLRITYDPVTAKDHRDATFLTQMHPLVLQAAHNQCEQLPCNVSLRVSDDSIPNGDYEFVIYAWKYVGLKPDIKLVAVSDNSIVQDNILSILHYASDYKSSSVSLESKWNELDSFHYGMWQKAKNEYIEEVNDDCKFRIEQLRQNSTKKESILKGQLANATDERIIRMKNSQIDKERIRFEGRKKDLENTILKADIHTQILVRGVIHID